MEILKIKTQNVARPSGIWTLKFIDEWTGMVVRTIRKKNHIPDIALFTYAAQFSSARTVNIGDNLYVCLGTDSTAAADGNVNLGAETLRKAVTVNESASVVASIYAYFTSSEVGGSTFREIGLKGNGNTTTASASANSGILFSRSAQTIAVPGSQGLQAQYDLTFSR